MKQLQKLIIKRNYVKPCWYCPELKPLKKTDPFSPFCHSCDKIIRREDEENYFELLNM